MMIKYEFYMYTAYDMLNANYVCTCISLNQASHKTECWVTWQNYLFLSCQAFLKSHLGALMLMNIYNTAINIRFAYWYT